MSHKEASATKRNPGVSRQAIAVSAEDLLPAAEVLKMPVTPETSKADIDRLFREAQANAGFQFLYTLVRVDGMQSWEGYEDEFLHLRKLLSDPAIACSLDNYQRLAAYPGPIKLLQNLVNCVRGELYDVSPLRSLVKGVYPNFVRPTPEEIVEFVTGTLRQAGFADLAGLFADAYLPQFSGAIAQETPVLPSAFSNLHLLLSQLLDRYYDELKGLQKDVKFVPLPGSLDVMQLLADDAMGGVCGLKIHFSQGCSAYFLRTPEQVTGANLEFGPPVVFLMMSMNPPGNGYRVDGKRLYECDFPGRYNKPFEWKPLIYPGDASDLIKECQQLSTDPDVQGVLLYMRLTGRKCIEIAVRSNMELPGTFTHTESGDVLIHKCPSDEDGAHLNVRVYDCTMILKSGTVEEIENGLTSFAWLMSVTFFPYGASYSWRNKYRMTFDGTGLLLPTHDDMTTVDQLLKKFPYEADGFVLGRGIDWYNMGNSATNPFTRFLCYYVAFESVAVAIFDGANLGVARPEHLNRTERRTKTIACIQEKHAASYDSDPVAFVKDSYFECVVGLKAKTKTIATQTFGENDEYVRLLFEKSEADGLSLSDLRSELAHGGVTLLDKTHEALIRKNLSTMGTITREFLLRVLFRLQPSDEVPTWCQEFKLGLSVADPRTTMWTTTDKTFPQGTTWKIRPEWCE